MRKKMLAALLAVSMVASMTACGSSKSESTDGAKEASDLKIGLITDVGGVNDGSFNQSSWEGLERAGEELGVTVNYLESATDADYKPNIETFIDEDYDLIISVGYMLADATREAAEANPDTKFAIIDDATIDLPNVTSLMFKAEQASYLVGYVAGLTTKTNNIGFIGGMELDTTKAKVECYEKAAQKINPDIKVSSAYAGSFSDTAKGKEIAASMVTTYDVDVMFGDASAVDTGAREALAGQEGRYDIGQPGDLGSADDKVIACSVVTDNAALVKTCMKDIEDGTFGNKTVYGDLSNGCLSVSTFSSIVPEDIQKQYLEAVEQIKAGTFFD